MLTYLYTKTYISRPAHIQNQCHNIFLPEEVRFGFSAMLFADRCNCYVMQAKKDWISVAGIVAHHDNC